MSDFSGTKPDLEGRFTGKALVKSRGTVGSTYRSHQTGSISITLIVHRMWGGSGRSASSCVRPSKVVRKSAIPEVLAFFWSVGAKGIYYFSRVR